MDPFDHMAEAELKLRIIEGLHTTPPHDLAQTHALLAIAKSLERIADQGDLMIARAER